MQKIFLNYFYFFELEIYKYVYKLVNLVKKM